MRLCKILAFSFDVNKLKAIVLRRLNLEKYFDMHTCKRLFKKKGLYIVKKFVGAAASLQFQQAQDCAMASMLLISASLIKKYLSGLMASFLYR